MADTKCSTKSRIALVVLAVSFGVAALLVSILAEAPAGLRPRRLGVGLAPLLGDGSSVDWWFAFKFTTAAFSTCDSAPKCTFGGDKETSASYKHGYGLQYVLASSVAGKTAPLTFHSDCLGDDADALAATYAQVFNSDSANYVVWNDQFYDEPHIDLDPACEHYCAGPWGHSKGMLAWGEDGSGFVLQVTTPDWPGTGNKNYKRPTQGETLGCCKDDNVLVAQHFFALRLSAEDTQAVLQALRRASVVTDPKNPQLVNVRSGPEKLSALAKSLGKVDDTTTPFKATLSTKTAAGSQVQLLAKPSKLYVAPWQLVSSMTGEALRVASWWGDSKIDSTKKNFEPGCWNKSLALPEEVQIATSGQWDGTKFSLLGKPTEDGNHAKLGHSTASGSKLAVMGDMNQAGALFPKDSGKYGCAASQNGRGGLFFVVEDEVLHSGLQSLLQGSTADYAGGGGSPPAPGPSPPGPPEPPSPPSPPAPPSPPSPPSPHSCGGAGTSWQSCKDMPNCVYVHAADAKKCGVERYGCYEASKLTADCHQAAQSPSELYA